MVTEITKTYKFTDDEKEAFIKVFNTMQNFCDIQKNCTTCPFAKGREGYWECPYHAFTGELERIGMAEQEESLPGGLIVKNLTVATVTL